MSQNQMFTQKQVHVSFGSSTAGLLRSFHWPGYLIYPKKYPLLINITGAGEVGDGPEEQLKKVLEPYTPARLD